MKTICAMLLLLVGLTAGTARPQEAPKTRERAVASAPQFPSGTDVVRLDLVVRAKDGTPITDLRADEIQVLEEKQPCAVSSFRLVQAEPAAVSVAAPGAGVSPADVVAPAPPAPAPQPESDLPASVVVLVFDSLGLDSAVRARQAALDMLAHPFPAGTWFTVLKVGYGLQVLQPLTTDASTLTPAIRLATVGAERSVEAASRPGYENATDEALSALLASGGGGALEATSAEAAMAAAQAQMLVLADAVQREQRGYGVFYPFLALARTLGNLQGRKTVLLFSEGLQVSAETWELMNAAISELNRANATVYAFDARGLTLDSPSGLTRKAIAAGAMGSRRATSIGSTSRNGVRAAEMGFEATFMNAQGNLQDLADSTGGLLVANTNDLRPGLARVAADLRSYYEIAYVPPNPAQDGRWRSIKVRVTRPGVQVRARQGYYAMPPGKPVVRPSELPLVAALEQQPLPRALDLRAATIPIAGSGADRATVVLAEVPIGAARFDLRDSPQGQLAHARLSLLGLVRDGKGRLVTKLAHDKPFDVPAGEVAALRRQMLVLRRTLTLPPGRYTLEIAAIDRASGRLGARRVPFEVVVGGALELGGLAVADAQPPAADAVDADPLRVGDRTAVPRLGRPIVAGVDARVGVYFSLHTVAAEAPDVALEIRRDGQVVGRALPELPKPGGDGRIAYIGTLAAERFTPGRYEVWAIARQGTLEARQGTSFEVVEAGKRKEEDRRPPATLAPEVADLLAKAGQYVVDFQEQFRFVVAEETSTQWAGSRHRTLRSDLAFVTFPGEIPWATFRDVYEVDGAAVRDRGPRLEKLLAHTEKTAMEQALEIARASARYNLGPLYRTTNVPTLALTFLHPSHHWRFRWERKGKQTFFGHDGIELRAEETARPTLVRGLDDADVPAKARFWIEASTGRVLRSETQFHLRQGAHIRQGAAQLDIIGWIDTQYRPHPGLGLWVPDEMVERHENVPSGGDPGFDGLIRATARYANHRRFGVDVGEGPARLPEPDKP